MNIEDHQKILSECHARHEAEIESLRQQLAAAQNKQWELIAEKSPALVEARQKLADHLKREVMLRDDIEHIVALCDGSYIVGDFKALKVIRESAKRALAATWHGSANQDKAAIFKALGLVPWDNKPQACTDTVWIEPGKVAIKEIKE